MTLVATKLRIGTAPTNTDVDTAWFGIAGRHAAPEAVVTVLDTKDGPVTWIDKAKAYYKGLIALLGAILTAITTLTLPEPMESWVTVTITTITAILVILRANETWIDGLGS